MDKQINLKQHGAVCCTQYLENSLINSSISALQYLSTLLRADP